VTQKINELGWTAAAGTGADRQSRAFIHWSAFQIHNFYIAFQIILTAQHPSSEALVKHLISQVF
jgi:hypothetical protein